MRGPVRGEHGQRAGATRDLPLAEVQVGHLHQSHSATHIILYYNPSKGYYCQWSLAVIRVIWINSLVSHAQDNITSHFIANSTLLPEQKYASSFHHCGQRWHFGGGVYYIEVFQVG